MIDWQGLRDTVGILALLKTADKLGLSRSACLANTDINIKQLEDPFANVKNWQELCLYRNLQALAPEHLSVGLMVSEYYDIDAMGMLGLGMASCPTLEQAFQFSGKFRTFGLSFSIMKIKKRDGTLCISLDHTIVPKDCKRFCIERGLSAGTHLIRDLCGLHLIPTSVSFTLDEPKNRSDYDDFFGVKVAFSAPENLVRFTKGVAELPLPSANTRNVKIAEQYCQEMRQIQVSDRALSQKLQQLILDHQFKLDAEQAAQLLGISNRSLRRKLALESTNFRDLVLNAKMTLAQRLLNKGVRVNEIASLLDYGEAASFTRAFKKRTGMTPKKSVSYQ